MTNLMYLPAYALLMAAGYFLAKITVRYYSKSRRLKADIEEIHLQQLDNFWSPDLNIVYSYTFNGKNYQGKDFLRIDQILPGESFVISNRRGMPCLSTGNAQLLGEEYIETYLLSIQNTVLVEFSASDPGRSKIYRKRSRRKTLFQDISVDFPWK